MLASCKENRSGLEEELAFEVWYRLDQMEGVSPGSLQEVQQVCCLRIAGHNSELRKFDKLRKDLALQHFHMDYFEQNQASYTVEHSEVEEEQAGNQMEKVSYKQV